MDARAIRAANCISSALEFGLRQDEAEAMLLINLQRLLGVGARIKGTSSHPEFENINKRFLELFVVVVCLFLVSFCFCFVVVVFSQIKQAFLYVAQVNGFPQTSNYREMRSLRYRNWSNYDYGHQGRHFGELLFR